MRRDARTQACRTSDCTPPRALLRIQHSSRSMAYTRWMAKQFMPYGVIKALAWKSRFEAIGLRASTAVTCSLSPAARADLVRSRIEQLPPELRTRMSLVVDAGANSGQWLSALLRFVDVERAEVFEPNPQAFELLRLKFANDTRINLHQAALGERRSRATLNVTWSSDLASLLTQAPELFANYGGPASEVTRAIVVDVAALDDWMESVGPIDLLKIDVQGFERFVLNGARKTLENTRAILIEMNYVPHYQGESEFYSLYSHIVNDLGFEFWDLSPVQRSNSGRALWADAVFVRQPVSSERSAISSQRSG